MKFGKFKIISSLFFLLSIGFAVEAWDNKKAHPSLTSAAISVFENRTGKDLSDQEADWVVEGSIEEDLSPRYFNHFFDPTTGKGLHYLGMQGSSAKEWALERQIGSGGDYSLPAVLENYEKENYKRAWQGVGHILHLIEDMAVPAHVRLDPHGDGDPFEAWASENGEVPMQVEFRETNNIANVFDDLATYTHNNFLSKDSVFKDDLLSKIDKFEIKENSRGEKIKYFYYNDYLLLKSKIKISGDEYFFDGEVNSDYWKLLSPKAVGYSAGVLDYIVRQFEEIDKNRTEPEKLGFWQGLKNKVVSAPRGVWNFIANSEEDARYAFGDATGKVSPYIEGALKKIWIYSDPYIDKAGQIAGDMKNTGKEILEKTGDVAESAKEKIKVLAAEYDNEDTGEQVRNEPVKRSEPKLGVEYVIDGDTIKLTNGEKVRYIGVDSPELGKPGPEDDECLAWAARLANMDLLSGGELRLVKDPNADRDKYGRLLRYVYVGDVFVNAELAERGLAEEFFCGRNWKNCPEAKDGERVMIIKEAAGRAEKNKLGIYSGVCDEDSKPSLSRGLDGDEEENLKPPKSPKPPLSRGLNDGEEEVPEGGKWDLGYVYTSGPSSAEREETGSSADEQVASSTDETASSTDGVVEGFGDENEESSGESETPQTPQPPLSGGLDLDIKEFYLFDTLTGNRNKTSTSTVSVFFDVDTASSSFLYILSSQESDQAEIDWSGADVFESGVFPTWDLNEEGPNSVWLYAKASTTVAVATSTIELDTTPPEPPQIVMPDLADRLSGSEDVLASLSDFEFDFESDDIYWLNRNPSFIFGKKSTSTAQIKIASSTFAVATSTVDWSLDYDFGFDCLPGENSVNSEGEIRSCFFEAGYTWNEIESRGFFDNIWQKEINFQAIDEFGRTSSSSSGIFGIDKFAPTAYAPNFKRTKSLNYGLAYPFVREIFSPGKYSESGVADVAWRWRKVGDEAWRVGRLDLFPAQGVSLYIFKGDFGESYEVGLTGVDRAGNVAEWSESSVIDFSSGYPVISEIYAGGGNVGANWSSDFVELYNPTPDSVDLTGYSLQYAPSGSDNWRAVELSGQISPNGFYLVEMNYNEEEESDLPTPDAVGSINMAVSAGKIALVSKTEIITDVNDEAIVDLLGWGRALSGVDSGIPMSMSNPESLERKAMPNSTAEMMGLGGEHENKGNGWDNNNHADWVLQASPSPQNSASPKEDDGI